MKNLLVGLLLTASVLFSNSAFAYCDSMEFIPASEVCVMVDSNNHPVHPDNVQIYNGQLRNLSSSDIIVRCAIRTRRGYFYPGEDVPSAIDRLDSFTVYYKENNSSSSDPYFILYPVEIESSNVGLALASTYLNNDAYTLSSETFSDLSFSSAYDFLTVYTVLPKVNGSSFYRLISFKICYEEW